MKKGHGIFSYILITIVFSFIMALQINCSSDSSAGSPAEKSTIPETTPEVFVSTGFPQVVVVSGTDYEMGRQYGQQTATRLVHNVAILKSRLYDQYGKDTVTSDMKVWDYYIKKYTPGMSDWFRGMVAGCSEKGYRLDYYDMVLSAVYPNESWARPAAPYPGETGVPQLATTPALPNQADRPPHFCNALAAMGEDSADGKPILALDSMVSTDAMDNVILIAFPTNGSAFITQSSAGKLAGNMGMNSKGFAWAMTAIIGDTSQWGIPEGYFQWLCQTATTPAEAQQFIETTPRGGVAGGFVMADETEVMVLEANAEHFHLRIPQQMGETGEWLVQTNHLVDTSLKDYNPGFISFTDSPKRYDTVFRYLTEATASSEKVDWTFIKSIFASDDWYDSETSTWHINEPGGPGISNSSGTTTTNIFQPATLTAYLGTGIPSGIGSPAYATGEYVKLKLLATPKKVANEADIDTQNIYWDSVNTFQMELNANPAYLTLPVISEIEEKLDKAWYAYSAGLDRLGYATLETNADKARELFAAALTYYAEAQMYAQEAKTYLLRAKGL